MARRHRVFASITTLCALSLLRPPALADNGTGWRAVTGSTCSVSGLARIEQPKSDGAAATSAQFLAVHDNKSDTTPRISLLTVTGVGADCRVVSLSLKWPGKNPPKDLEAICTIPGQDDFLVTTSKGDLFRIEYTAGKAEVKVKDESDGELKNENPTDDKEAEDIEGICATKVGDELVLLWSTRGHEHAPARLHVGKLNDKKAKVSHARLLMDVPPPFKDVKDLRTVSDLRVDGDGWLWASAARDPGAEGFGDEADNGPFESKLFVVGRLKEGPSGPSIEPPPPPQAAVAPAPKSIEIPDHKVEAFEFYGGKHVLIGADDEDLGGFVEAQQHD